MALAFTFDRGVIFGVFLLFVICDGENVIFCKIKNGSVGASQLAVSPNDDVSLNCSVVPQGTRASRITWTGGQRNYSKDIVSAQGLWSNLRLNNVSVEDAGKYKCEVSNEAYKDVCTITLQVNSPPYISRTSGYFTTSPQVLSVGDVPVFHCYASGWPSPSLVWLKDGKEIRNGDADDSYELIKQPGGLDLKIVYVRQTVHEGKYTCVARNQYGRKRHSILLSVPDFVVMQPEVRTSVSQVAKRKNEDALLTCAGQNTPGETTVVSWAFNGTDLPLENDDEFRHVMDYVYFEEQSVAKVNFSLLIRNVTERDTGAYSCKALTLTGVDSDTIFLRLVANELHRPERHSVLLTALLLASAGILCGLGTAITAHRLKTKRRRHAKGDLPSTDFQHDVFISFSSLDYHWVRDHLTPVLDRKRINYCIHSRDFVVGKAIMENIADSVYNSRKVLAVISKNFMESKFCREELEMALYRCTEMADSSLILIRVDNVDHKRLPKTLRRRTFIDYSCAMERGIWEERLLKHVEFEKEGCKFDISEPSNSTDELINCLDEANV